MMTFIVDVCNSFSVSNDGVRVGLIAFSEGSQVEISLTQYNSLEDVNFAIQNIAYQCGDRTCTSKGLDDLRGLMMAEGRSPDKGVPRFAIVLTDGR